MYLVVGFDPGTSVGIGIINFKGDVVDIFSGKNMGINEVVAHIINFGTTALVASDVDHIPYTLYKVATALDAKIFIPENSISVSEKVFLTRNVRYRDAHQRDALSAALYAYKRYKNLFEKIKNMGYGDDVKAMVIKGKSIAEAIAITYSEPEEREEGKNRTDIRDISKDSEAYFEISRENFADLKEHLRILEKANKILKTEIATKDIETENLKEQIKGLEREKKFKSEKCRTDEEKFEKMAMEISFKGIKEQLKNAEDVIKRFENFYEKIGKGEIYLVGKYPEIFNGLTYIDKHDVISQSDTGRIEIAFTKKRITNCKNVSPQKLKEISDIYYIERNDLEEIRKSSDIESIIEEYRKARKFTC
ncbi:MAG: DUF460 domain-containing protein [Candidatus Altiarchaeum hamiconexum]|uniref:DUF460 domain-containing protein n=1 Tax=Candidatus Altarchaeum hamiconexum TaxID=1803513 RepID=A0A8J7Z1U6_9ARCH|nr:DUF460 domain-containing protein [Candidatus Altarchaeum hamiconexum]OIQ06217.1 MAG: hypothetical protein AUK59_00675 [Candidatus Altarchaeum sp. CG2_30_32_3053]PIV27846.1 MAG: hypothetical protein COS36_04315 [Candidatus Altarchaeum sp. CG03_land_8_20_14_0_80_32_618]PIX48343.1 MAG: hypothetical protein COZ53_04255 [Candidatus Altarchaeum sp. CG_4_8_14_3_um_filter_33_2054]PIZ29731.1 MAG: hypothetical protein COY41_05120 [Candidatus Altarchaeum sp. CG_4_10_14_0_8_um_filter_32_851]PJC16013.1 